MQEYIVYNNSDNFYEIDNLVRYSAEPRAFNSMVRIKKYKITIEEIHEDIKVLRDRVKDLYNKSDNYHEKEALNEYSKRLFGVNVLDLDKEFTEEEKIELLKNIVERAGTERIDLSFLNWKFESIHFDYSKTENFYTWSATWNYKVTGYSNYYIPCKSSNIILTFKTLEGAKRNFIKKLLKEKD